MTSDDAMLQANYLGLSLTTELLISCTTHVMLFGFEIVSSLHFSGSIPKKHGYAVVVSQLIHYARCCQKKVNFVECLLLFPFVMRF